MSAARTQRTVLTTVLCALLALQGGMFAFMGCAMASAAESCCCHNHGDARAEQADDASTSHLRTGPCCCAASAADRQQSAAVAPEVRSGSVGVDALTVPVFSILALAPTLVLPAPPSPVSTAGPPILLQTCAFLI